MRKRTMITGSVLAAIIMILSLLFTGCAAKTAAPKYPEYADVSFGGELLSYLAEPREAVAEGLHMTDDTWEYLRTADGSRDNPRPNRKAPVTVDGKDYTLYLRFTEGPEADSPSYLSYFYYDRTVETEDTDAKLAEVRALYDLLTRDFGEPEEQYPRYSPKYVRDGLEENLFSGPYTEIWVLAEHVAWPDMAEDINVVLLCTLQVQPVRGGLELKVEYRLEDSAYTGLARYPQRRAATGEFYPD